MTLEQFLAWEERQETKNEFDGFEPVAMIGVTDAHAAIQVNLISALNLRLRGRPCRPRGSDTKVEVAGRIRYPDALVFCNPVPPDTMVIREPVVVFEILSATSTYTDLVLKNREYRATPSIQRYVVLHQDRAGATIFARKGEDWDSEALAGDDAVLRMPEIGVDIPLPELYTDVQLAKPADPEPA